MLLIAAAIRLVSLPRLVLHSVLCSSRAPRFFLSFRSRGTMYVRAHVYTHTHIYLHVYICIHGRCGSKSTHPPPADPSETPRKQSVHVNDRPSRSLSFPPHLRAGWARELQRWVAKESLRKEKERGRERERKRKRKRERSRPLALHSDEIFALSLCREILRIARLRVCARSDGRKQGERRREGDRERERSGEELAQLRGVGTETSLIPCVPSSGFIHFFPPDHQLARRCVAEKQLRFLLRICAR